MWSLCTIHNETPYTFHYCSKGREVSLQIQMIRFTLSVVIHPGPSPLFQGVRTVLGNSTGEYPPTFPLFWGLSFRYGDHSESDLTGSGAGASYTIRESKDHKEFELVNNMLWPNVVDRCPNFGKYQSVVLLLHKARVHTSERNRKVNKNLE